MKKFTCERVKRTRSPWIRDRGSAHGHEELLLDPQQRIIKMKSSGYSIIERKIH